MGFVNPILGGGGALVRPAIKSPNYAAGSTGWSINRDGSAEFADGTFRGTLIGASFQTAASGRRIEINVAGSQSMELYDDSDNLLLAVGDVAGGISSYDPTDDSHELDVIDGQLQFLTDHGGGGILSQGAAMYNNAHAVVWRTLLAGGVALDTDHGALVATVPGADTLETWHAPSFTANFAGGSTAGTYQAFQYRWDVQDGVVAEGAFHCTASVTSVNVFTLPTGYRPKTARAYGLISDSSTGAVQTGAYLLQVNSNGQVNLHCSAATAVNQNFYGRVVIPRGDVA